MTRRALFINAGCETDDEIRRGLAEAGFTDVRQVSVCAGARAVLADASETTFDLIAIDLASEREQRLALCRSLAHQLSGVPLLVIDDARDDVRVDEVLAAGVTDLLRRPFSHGDVLVRGKLALNLRAERVRNATRERRLVAETERLERRNEALAKMLWVDPLTGLVNRDYAWKLLATEWSRATRSGAPLGLIAIDLDLFHSFNEQYGHPGGDACLKQVAEVMTHCLRRPTDFLARFGGEEFIAVLASTPAEGVRIVADRMRRAVAALSIPHGGSEAFGVVTISVGFAACTPAEGRATEHLLALADAALFQAKAQGRNQICGDSGDRYEPQLGRTVPPGTPYPVVVVDPVMVDRIPDLLAETKAETRVLAEALFRGNFDRIQLLGHRLSTTARDWGLHEIAKLAAQLDVGARSADVQAIQVTLDELSTYVERVQVVYRRVQAPGFTP